MFYREWLQERIVIGEDWPLSLGWKIAFYSCNKNFVGKDVFISKKQIVEANRKKKDIIGVEGLAMAWNHKRVRAIAIFYTGKSSVRFIELITHEVSHVIDHILEDAAIKNVDTELRAYLMDWIVGKILQITNLNNKTSEGYETFSLPKKRKKNNKKKKEIKKKGKKVNGKG